MDETSIPAHHRAEKDLHEAKPTELGGHAGFAGVNGSAQQSAGPEGTEVVEPMNRAFHSQDETREEATNFSAQDGNRAHPGRTSKPLGDEQSLQSQMSDLKLQNSEVVDYGHENQDVLQHDEVMGEGIGLPPKPVSHACLDRPMSPWLQLMCSPLLSYYTIQNDVWYGAVLVVAFDAGSEYSRLPSIQLSSKPSKFSAKSGNFASQPEPIQSTVEAHKLYQYYGPQGPSTFWRFWLEIPLKDYEQNVTYSVNNGGEMDFLVAARGENLRWAAHSCNGFSAGVDVDSFKGEGFESGFDPVWADLLDKHNESGLHAIVGGGDQLYCDSITREPELADWVNENDGIKKIAMPLTKEIEFAVNRYYFSHYCKMFRGGAFGKVNCQVPMMNMLDDHDLIDGFGSYEDATMRAPIFNYIGQRGYFWYLMFQVFTNDAVDGTDRRPGSHPIKSMVICNDGAFIPFPNHSQICYMGPSVQMCMLDCRAERKLDQICTEETYNQIFPLLERLPPSTEQLIMLLGVPIAYPRMSIAENVLSSKFNPINWAAKIAPGNLGGYSNKFDTNVELLDDLSDHWCAKLHKAERNDLIKRLQEVALVHKLRITFLSGDVHCAAVGELRTLYHKESHKVEPSLDHRMMYNVVTSAIVNTPPPLPPVLLANTFASHKHRTLHHHSTDEISIPLFETDTDGSARKRTQYVMDKRNYALFQLDKHTHELIIDIQVEIAKGVGKTKGYRIVAAPPRW